MTENPGEPRWLDDEEMRAWLALNGVILLLPGTLDSQMQRDNGITMFEYLVMAMLSEAPGRTLQLKRLASVVNGSLSRLSHVVTRLEKRDWVRREPAPDNGRITMATLTDAGYEKVVGSSASPSGCSPGSTPTACRCPGPRAAADAGRPQAGFSGSPGSAGRSSGPAGAAGTSSPSRPSCSSSLPRSRSSTPPWSPPGAFPQGPAPPVPRGQGPCSRDRRCPERDPSAVGAHRWDDRRRDTTERKDPDDAQQHLGDQRRRADLGTRAGPREVGQGTRDAR
jgi:DNA-binding MarR family transcriptional regulator